MSKQLVISAAFSVLAMAAFAISADASSRGPSGFEAEAGMFEIAAPEMTRAPAFLPTLPFMHR